MLSTIDEVLTELEGIIKKAVEENDRVGYFAALYYLVTSRVNEGIRNGEFQDGPRMERLDVSFANRYLEALKQWRKDGQVTTSWKIAFDNTRKPSRLVLQQLLLGINAHINLDLGISSAEIMKGQHFADIRKDFITINNIISSLTNELLNDISRVSPLLSLLGLHATNNASVLVQFSIGNARDGAWTFGEELAAKAGLEFADCVTERDKTITQLAKALTQPKGFMKLTLWVVHLFEWKSPSRIITVLRTIKKTDLKKSDLSQYA